MAERTHQPPDLETRRVLLAGSLIVAAVIVAVAVAWLVIASLGGERRVVQAPPHTQPPQLETEPLRDRAEYQRREQAKISEYGWVDQRAGVVRIPVERAMDVLAARGESGNASRTEEGNKAR